MATWNGRGWPNRTEKKLLARNRRDTNFYFFYSLQLREGKVEGGGNDSLAHTE